MSMIVELMKRLTGAKTTPSAADLRAAEVEARGALIAAEAAIVRMEQERADALIGGDDKAVERVEARGALMVRERDRAKLAIEALAARAKDAESKEAAAALDRQVADAEAAAARAARLIFARYEGLAGELSGLLAEAQVADEAVRVARHAALVAGRSVDLPFVEERLAPAGRLFQSIVATASLRPAGRFAGFGAARREAEALGFTPELVRP